MRGPSLTNDVTPTSISPPQHNAWPAKSGRPGVVWQEGHSMRPFKIAHFLLTGTLILGGCAGTQGSQTPMQSSPTSVAATLTPSTPAPDGRAPTPIYGQSAGEVRTPSSVRLILSHAPRLEESAHVTLVITSTLDAPGATAEIVLPPERWRPTALTLGQVICRRSSHKGCRRPSSSCSRKLDAGGKALRGRGAMCGATWPSSTCTSPAKPGRWDFHQNPMLRTAPASPHPHRRP